MSVRRLSFGLLGLLVIGCGGSDGSMTAVSAQAGGGPSGTGSALAAPVQVLSPSVGAEPPALQSLTAAALADAAQRTGLDTSALKVISAEAVTWPDGSLGCPVPGMLYTMALVPGYRVRIQAGSEGLHYHASARGAMILCSAALAIEPSPLDPK